MKSLNSIFKDFRKTMAQLDAFIAKTDKQIDQNQERMAELQSDNLERYSSKDKANRARAKIADLIGEDE